jgi:hypothetical protein
MQTINPDSKQAVKRSDSLETMLGWHSAAVFEAGEYQDGDRISVNKTTEIIVLTDPYPEYKKFVFADGELSHASELTAASYENVFKQNLHDYGKANLVPLAEVECIQRDDRNIPKYTGD